MSIVINIPAELESLLRQAWGAGVDRAVLEALAIKGYRDGKFGSATVGKLLGHTSRWETERWLAERAVPLNYTTEDLEADRRTLDRLFSKSS